MKLIQPTALPRPKNFKGVCIIAGGIILVVLWATVYFVLKYVAKFFTAIFNYWDNLIQP